MGERRRWPGWLYLVVIAGSILMALGGTIALIKPGMLLAPNEAISPGVRPYAGYLASRNLALAGMLIAALLMRTGPVLWSLMLLTAFIQLLDAAIDIMEGRWMLVPGVLVVAAVFFLAERSLARRFSMEQT